MDNSASNTCEGFVLEIDGHFVSEFGSITAALNAGLALRHEMGEHEVRVHEQVQTPVKEEPVFHWWMTLADPTQGM